MGAIRHLAPELAGSARCGVLSFGVGCGVALALIKPQIIGVYSLGILLLPIVLTGICGENTQIFQEF